LVKSFLEYAKNRGVNSTVIGVSNVIRSNSLIIRLAWIIIWLGSFGFCLYLVISLFISYFQFNVRISISYKTDSDIDFPAVSVCNLNIYNYDTSNVFIQSLLTKNNLTFLNDIRNTTLNPKIITTFIKSNIAGDKNLRMSDRENLGYTMNYMLLNCYMNDVLCNASDFVWKYDYDFVNCYVSL
jgi:hypothetical protein